MSETSSSSSLPAQARLMKLKQKLKESKKTSSSPKISSKSCKTSTRDSKEFHPYRPRVDRTINIIPIPDEDKKIKKNNDAISKDPGEPKKTDQPKPSPSEVPNTERPAKISFKIARKNQSLVRENTNLKINLKNQSKEATSTIKENTTVRSKISKKNENLKITPPRVKKTIESNSKSNLSETTFKFVEKPFPQPVKPGTLKPPTIKSSSKTKINKNSDLLKNKKLSENNSNSFTKSEKKSSPITETGKKNLFKRKSSLTSPSSSSADLISQILTNEGPEKGFDDGSSPGKKLKKDGFSQNQRGGIKRPVLLSRKKKLYEENENEVNFNKNYTPGTKPCSKSYGEENLSDDFMEWEPTTEEILRSTRNEIDAREEMMDWQDEIDVSSRSEFQGKSVYFVVDTNVLIQSISLISKLLEKKNYIRGFNVIIMVPWQVLKELDKLKSSKDCSLSKRARAASKYLSNALGGGQNIIFQKQSLHFEDCPQILVEVPDDHLIKCCCQLKNEHKNVILLSNDINLRVKTSATADVPSVPDSWISELIDIDFRHSGSTFHCFETEPKENVPNCRYFLYKLTQSLHSFLSNIVWDKYKAKYNEMWPLWIPTNKMGLEDLLSSINSLPIFSPFQKQLNDIWKFYKENTSYESVKAIDVEQLGRNCNLFASAINHLAPEFCLQFDKDMGFMKTGNLNEQTYGYSSASCLVAQQALKNMEDKLHSYLNYLNELMAKIVSQKTVVPDIRPIINKIDRHITVTNEATTAFLLLSEGEEVPLRCPEISLFYKVLMNFLEVVQDELSLPLFTPEDISFYINQERSHINPGGLQWLSDIRRQFSEYKSFLRNQ